MQTSNTTLLIIYASYKKSKINFSDIIKSIKVFLNFHPDSYPVILSLENHCSLNNQKVMAEILIKILDDALYIPDEDQIENDLELPSPEK